VRQFVCSRGLRDQHTFTITTADDRPVIARRDPCPPCEFHPTGHITRAGSYGTSAEKRKQRYLCDGAGEVPPHYFTPPLPRAQVKPGCRCPNCQEFIPVHHGEAATARKHRWPPKVIALTLKMLATGTSYGEASIEARKAVGLDTPDPRRIKRVKPLDTPVPEEFEFAERDDCPPEPDDLFTLDTPEPPRYEGTVVTGPSRRRAPSLAALKARRAWHLAADWVEVFSPIIWDPLEARLRATALAEQARLDADAQAGRPLVRPTVIVIDDVPVWKRRGRTKRKDGGFHLLVVGEVTWVHLDRPRPDQPAWVPELHLRMIRALAKSTRESWLLVFDELGYTPTFVVADAGTPIKSAIKSAFGDRTTFVPSIWHVRQAVLRALGLLARRAVQDPDLIAHTNRLNGKLLLSSVAEWNRWWDDLLALVAGKGLPTEKILAVQKNYRTDYAKILPRLGAYPGVLLSSGGIEELIRHRTNSVLDRRTQFGNAERTNALMDLVVANERGALSDLDAVARAIRKDAEDRKDASGKGGWAVTVRSIDDPQPPGEHYSSLRDPNLAGDLLRARRKAQP
jgi:hypothetical protein